MDLEMIAKKPLIRPVIIKVFFAERVKCMILGGV